MRHGGAKKQIVACALKMHFVGVLFQFIVVFGAVFRLITDVKWNSVGQRDYKQENGNFVPKFFLESWRLAVIVVVSVANFVHEIH